MVHRELFFGVVLAIEVCRSFTSCKAAEQKTKNDRDTVILAKSIQPFIIDSNSFYYQAVLQSEEQLYDGSAKTWLLLDDPQVMQQPEGVYEVYITIAPADIHKLSPAMPGFINVLDIYSLTADEPKKSLAIDLDKHTGKWLKIDPQPFPSLYITILFRGNKSPGGTESKRAGKISVKGIRIIQEKS